MEVQNRCMLGCTWEVYHAIRPLYICEAQLQRGSKLGMQLSCQVHSLLGIRLEEALPNLRPCVEHKEGSGMLSLARIAVTRSASQMSYVTRQDSH